jgi:hypothetical protein
VEQVVVTLPKDVSQMVEEIGQNLLASGRHGIFLSVDEFIDVFTGPKGILPLFHLEASLELLVPQLQQFVQRVFFLEFNRKRDLLLKLFRHFGLLQDLDEVDVQSVRYLQVLFLVVVL